MERRCGGLGMAESLSSRIAGVARFKAWRSRRRARPGAVTSLDIEGSLLRVVVASVSGGKVVVSRVASVPLELGPDADRGDATVVGRAVAGALRLLQLKPGLVVMGVPRAQVVLRTLQLPAMKDERQLASMVRLQLARDLPFRAEEAVIDFKVGSRIEAPPARGDTGKTDTGAGDAAGGARVEVMVATLRRGVVDFHLQVAEVAGFRLAGLGLVPDANVLCVDACRLATGEGSIALVSLRPDEVSIDVMAGRLLSFSRGANVRMAAEPVPSVPGKEALRESEAPPVPVSAAAPAVVAASSSEGPASVEYPERVTIEVVRSLHSYGGLKPQSPVSLVVVAGGTGQEASVVEALGRRLSMPCRLLELSRLEGLAAEFRESAANAVSAIGLALGVLDAGGFPYDFLNPKQPAPERNLKRTRLLAAAAAVTVLLVGTLGVRAHLLRARQRILEGVEAEVGAERAKQSTYQRMIRQAATVDEWGAGGRNWLEVYAHLSAILPPCEEVYLTGFSVTGQGTVRLNVQAQSGEVLGKLDKLLRAAGYDVKPSAITPGADRFGYEFRSGIELVVPERMKIEAGRVKPPPRPTDDASLDPAAFRKAGGG